MRNCQRIGGEVSVGGLANHSGKLPVSLTFMFTQAAFPSACQAASEHVTNEAKQVPDQVEAIASGGCHN